MKPCKLTYQKCSTRYWNAPVWRFFS